jgi:hypothetical protein
MRPCALLALASFLFPAAFAAGCQDAKSAVEADWSSELPDEGHRLRETEALNAPATEPDAGSFAAWLGVRHDVSLAPGTPHAPRCSCLAVEVGHAGDPTFAWQGDAPSTDDALVLAIGARGVACPGGPPNDADRRASISAVDLDGKDVVIEIEDLPPGRPLALGAVIPRPVAGGGVFVRPKDSRVVYGRSSQGGRCRVQ